MAYVPSPYVPGQYQNRYASSLADLIRTQGAAQARGIRDAGDIQGQMWGHTGLIAATALSQLGQQIADAPKRKHEQMLYDEQARDLRKQHNFEGVERMAGEGGLDENKRADLYEQAGFHAQALTTRDAERQRQAQIFDHAGKELARQTELKSEAAGMLHGIEQLPIEQRADAWRAALPEMIKRVPKEWAEQAPQEYDPKFAQNALAIMATDKEKNGYLEQAAHQAALQHSTNAESREAEDHAKKAAMLALRSADSPEEWEQQWQYIEAHTPKDIQALFPRKFSPDAIKQVRDMVEAQNPDKSLSPYEAKYQTFVREHGREPNTQQEIDALNNQFTNTQYRYNPLTGGRGPNPDITPTQRRAADAWAKTQYVALEKKRVTDGLSDEDMDAAKEGIQSIYLSKIGIEDGQTLADRAKAKGENIAGTPLASLVKAPTASPAPATPAVAPQQPAPQAARFAVTLPDGTVRYAPTRETAAAAQAQIDKLPKQQAPQSQPAPVQAPVAPVAAAPVPPPVAGRGTGYQSQSMSALAAPMASTQPKYSGTVVVQWRNGRVERMTGTEAEQLEAQGKLKVLPPTTLADIPGAAWAKKELPAAWAQFKHDIKK